MEMGTKEIKWCEQEASIWGDQLVLFSRNTMFKVKYQSGTTLSQGSQLPCSLCYRDPCTFPCVSSSKSYLYFGHDALYLEGLNYHSM